MLQDPSVAFPLASVVRSVPVRSSPRVSASNVTDTPARPLPKASVTFATGRIPTAWPTTTYWNASLTAVTAAAAPALAVACAVAERPPVVAVRVCAPTVAPRVQETVNSPPASVVPFCGEADPPWPVGTAALIETPATAPWAPDTLKTTWTGSQLPPGPGRPPAGTTGTLGGSLFRVESLLPHAAAASAIQSADRACEFMRGGIGEH